MCLWAVSSATFRPSSAGSVTPPVDLRSLVAFYLRGFILFYLLALVGHDLPRIAGMDSGNQERESHDNSNENSMMLTHNLFFRRSFLECLQTREVAIFLVTSGLEHLGLVTL